MYHEPTGSWADRLFGVFLLGLALALGVLLFHEGYGSFEAFRWSAVPCQVVAGRVDEQAGENPYLFRVRYRYEWAGRPHDGDVYRKEYRGSWDVAEADRLARNYPLGAKRRCFVNPRDPTEAILAHDDLWPAVVIVVFFAFAVWIIARFYLFPSREKGRASGIKVGRTTGFLCGLFLCLAGLAGFAWASGVPLWKASATVGWSPVPCKVVSSRVRSVDIHGEVSFRAYWPDIVYRYSVNGVTYRSNTRGLADLATPWYYGQRNEARRYPARALRTCFVDPRDPSRAVLVRPPGVATWIGIVPLAFAAIGAGGCYEAATGRKVRIGSTKGWERLLLYAAVVFAVQLLILMGRDLLLDLRAGTAEWPETFGVVAVGALASALAMGGVKSFRRRRVPPSPSRASGKARSSIPDP